MLKSHDVIVAMEAFAGRGFHGEGLCNRAGTLALTRCMGS